MNQQIVTRIGSLQFLTLLDVLTCNSQETILGGSSFCKFLNTHKTLTYCTHSSADKWKKLNSCKNTQGST